MAYEVHLKEFDGPLDLLLHLIEQAKVDIKDIFISEITNQYLSLMEELDELDMDTASEFLTMAATLVYIKSRSLLPKPPKEAEEEEDPEEALVRQLKEYKLFKQAGEKLNELSAGMRGLFSRLREQCARPRRNLPCRLRNMNWSRPRRKNCSPLLWMCLTVKNRKAAYRK